MKKISNIIALMHNESEEKLKTSHIYRAVMYIQRNLIATLNKNQN